ncbi:MAG: insulinase family protein [Planctomycetes bacterium]|nr:insulinase family protein [Planctomycetota bacterium]
MKPCCTVIAWVVLAIPAFAQPLPTDPELIVGELDNGLSYVIREHWEPPARVTMWLHVSSGSLNETDEQRGVAHYLEHMAFNGTEHFPPGTLREHFEDMGLTFGRHQNAHTGFDHTAYKIQLPENDIETLDAGMLFLADAAFGMLLLEDEIDAERQIILEEKRTREGGQQRATEKMLERIAPGSIFGLRLPIGTEERLRNMQRPQFTDYYTRWYVPSNMTLIVVGDADPDDMLALIKRHFSRGERTPRPTDQDPAVKPYPAHRAIVVTDPELVASEIGIHRVGPPRAPATDEQALRRDLVERLGQFAFNRRLGAIIDAGDAAFLTGGASARDFANAIRWTQLTARGEPDSWRASLRQIATELQRARLHGFAASEIDAARSEMLAQVRFDERTAGTVPSSRLLASYNSAIAAGRPILSPAQRLELFERYVPSITPNEVSASFAETFATDAVAFVLLTPSGAGVPTEEQLLALGRDAISVLPEPLEQTESATRFMADRPEGGKVVAIDQHLAAEVTSAWLGNNVRVHHRFMDTRKDQVFVTITLAGGQIEEKPENRGVSLAAARAWSRPATRSLSSTDVRDLMTGAQVSVRGSATSDALSIVVTGAPDELEHGLQLAHLMLTEPWVEQAALDRWKAGQFLLLNLAKTSPGALFGRIFWDAVFPDGNNPLAALDEPRIASITRDDAQAWLDRIIAQGPIEVAIVGDIDRQTALELVRDYIGTVPTRPRITPDTFADQRCIERPVGPRVLRREIPTESEQAIALAGFYNCDRNDTPNRRRMTMAADVLTARLLDIVREDEQLAYNPSASSGVGVVYPGFGLFFAAAFTDPDRADELIDAINTIFDDFAADGPTPEEMTRSKKKLATRLEEQMRTPTFWSRTLAELDYRGTDLDVVLEDPEAFQRLTADEVVRAFRSFHTQENRIEVVVTQSKSEADDRNAPAGDGGS